MASQSWQLWRANRSHTQCHRKRWKCSSHWKGGPEWPQDFLPDPTQSFDAFSEQVRELRDRTAELPDEYFVVLMGDMITEDALPTYQTMINTLDGVRDETGTSASPWAKWTWSWTAEENRHGDLLRTYLYLSGRVDMRTIERTVQYLISAGMGEFCRLDSNFRKGLLDARGPSERSGWPF
ncbi:hypothetical protein AAG906_032977 [Vitis piasezkii]